MLAHNGSLHHALTVNNRAEAALPCSETDRIGNGAEVELTDRGRLKNFVIGEHNRDRRIELAETAHYPVLTHFFVVAGNAHSGEKLFRYFDLTLAMNALVGFFRGEIALRFHAR